jgi:serine/threonine protein kinase
MIEGNGGRLERVMEEVPLKRVGRYDLLEVIGRGGAAVVYLARQSDLQRYVALKELAPFHAADETFASRFVEEGRVAGAMNHANIVTVHEFFDDGGVPYIAMEYLPNGSLRQYVDKLSLAQIAGVIEGVLAGLSHGGSQGIVHRDLKPENLLIAVDGRVKIADFGVARALNNAATRNVVTVTGTTIGTPAYMSPEQALGNDVTAASDLYSLGVIAWEMFAGRTPFGQTDTPVAVLYRHVHETIPSVATVAPEVDERVEAWVDRLLAKDPAERYQTAEEAWYDLEDVVLELLGPRWRRDARLAVDDAPATEPAPLTPAPFTETHPATPEPMPTAPPAAPAPSPSPSRRERRQREKDEESRRSGRLAAGRRDTEEPRPAVPPTAGAMATVAPSTKPKPSYTTILRPARRHRDQPGEDASAANPARRRMIVIGVVLAMAAAAVGGVFAAGGGGSSGPPRPSPAQVRAAEQRAQAATAKQQSQAAAAQRQAIVQDGNSHLLTIIGKLAPRRSRDVTRFANAGGPAAQIAAAQRVRTDYLKAAAEASVFTGQTSQAKPLVKALQKAAAGYGAMASAGRSQNDSRFNAARQATAAAEKALSAEVRKL